MPVQPKIRYTYEDYLSTPEDSSRRYEIVDGKLFVTAQPRFRHQEVALAVAAALREIALEHDLGKVVGPVSVRLADDTITEPDVVFVRSARLGIITPQGRVHGPPDLVVEILSPSTRDYDRTLKRKRYLESGVPELWIVDADERWIEVWRAGEGEPRTLRDDADRTIGWTVDARTFEIALADVFRT